MAILNEVYVGRLPEIEQMINDLHNIREEYKRKGNISILKSTKIMEKHIEEMWGFKAFMFDIYISKIPNAYTICAGNCIDCDVADVIQATNKGYRFHPNSNVSAVSRIATCLLDNDSLSDEELMAIILHEIGHSFVERADLVNNSMKKYRKKLLGVTIFYLILSIVNFNSFSFFNTLKSFKQLYSLTNTIYIKIEKIKKNIPGLRHLKMTGDQIIAAINDAITAFISNLGRGKGTEKEYKNIKKSIDVYNKNYSKKDRQDDQVLRRTKERISDDFANMYGLGPQVATGLIKIGNPYAFGLYKEDKTNELQKKIDAAMDEFSHMVDVHPSNYDRLLSMIEGLEYDYKNLKVDKKIKDQMKKDIDALKTLADEIKKCKGLLEDYDNKYMSKAASEAIKKGSTETKKEKQYNDRKQVNDDWIKKRIDI